MNNKADPNAPSSVENRIEELKAVPARDPLRAASGRARFLREAAAYKQAMSPEAQERPKKLSFLIRKQRLSMSALATLFLALSLLLGGGVTIAAAQDDLPNQSLYQVKLWTENATLAMNGDPQEEAELLMAMAQTRVQEMTKLAEMGIAPPEEVRERLQEHLDEVLWLAAGMDESRRDQLLVRLQEQLQTQDRVLEQVQTDAGEETRSQLSHTQQMLQVHLGLVDKGLAEPQGFQLLLENQIQHGKDKQQKPKLNQQGDPGGHQNGNNGNSSGQPGGNGNGSPGKPDPDKPNQGNGSPGGPNNNSQGGQDGQNGNGPGGGGNK